MAAAPPLAAKPRLRADRLTPRTSEVPDPTSYAVIGWIALALFSLAGGVNQVFKVVDRLKGNPPVENLAQRVAHLERNDEEAVARRRAIYNKMEDMEKRIRAEIKADLTMIFGEMNKLRDGQTGLERNDKFQNQIMGNIEGKLDRFIERHIKLQ